MHTKGPVEIDCDIQPKKKRLSKDSSFMDRKHVLIDSNFQPKKCAKRCLGNYDRISELPDEILIDILSLLSLAEAARTSILSSRWMNLWKHTPSLNFDGQAALENIAKHDEIRRELLESEGLKYVNWVDSVVQSHKSPTLKEFIIRFSLDITAKNSITQWLEFAFSRHVQSLKLDFSGYSSWPNFYCFPEDLLAVSSYTAPKLPMALKSLKELSFRNVHLADGVIESFLRNCPSLERLAVRQTNKISNVEVCGPSLRLKHLEILYCAGLKSLKSFRPKS